MQTKPEYLDRLINLASAAAGSDYRLAQQLSTSRQAVSQWRAGVRTCPAGDVALMAQVAGLNADEWAARAVIEQYATNPEKQAKVRAALKKASAAIGAAMLSSGAKAATAIAVLHEPVSYFIRCILC